MSSMILGEESHQLEEVQTFPGSGDSAGHATSPFCHHLTIDAQPTGCDGKPTIIARHLQFLTLLHQV